MQERRSIFQRGLQFIKRGNFLRDTHAPGGTPNPEKALQVAENYIEPFQIVSTGTKQLVREQTFEDTFGFKLNPEIQTGMITILDERVPKHVRGGNIRNLHAEGKAFSKGAGMAGIIEFTDEGKEFIREKVAQAIDSHISGSLEAIVDDVIYSLSHDAWLISGKDVFENGQARVSDLYDLAQAQGIPIFSRNASSTTSRLPVPLIVSKAELISYFESRIDEQMLTILEKRFETFGEFVGRGQLYHQDNFDNQIAEWLSVMENRGYRIVDTSDQVSDTGENYVVREQLRKKKDALLIQNLAKGFSKLPSTFKYRLRNAGDYDEYMTDSVNFQMYISEGERLGLVNWEGEKLTGIVMFNPSLLDGELENVLRETLDFGLQAVVDEHLANIVSGNINSAKNTEKKLAKLLALAERYGISVHEETYHELLREHITPRNLQKGIQGRIDTVNDYLRKGDFFHAEIFAKGSTKVLELASENGLLAEVDPQPLYEYLDSINIHIPRIQARNPRGRN